MKKVQFLILISTILVSLSSCAAFLEGMAAGMSGYGYGMGYMPSYGYGYGGGSNMNYLLDPNYAIMQVAQKQASMNSVNEQLITKTIQQVNSAEQEEYQEAKKYRPNLTLEQFRKEKAQAYQNTKSTANTSTQSTTSTDYKQRTKDILNATAGEKCLSCKGSGKCAACNGTKIAHGFGNSSYICNVCNDKGDCPVCDGTGKSSWNR